MPCWREPYVHVGGGFSVCVCVFFWLHHFGSFEAWIERQWSSMLWWVNVGSAPNLRCYHAPTFDGVPEALGGGGVIRGSVEGVELQAVQHVLGLWQPLHHGPCHVARRVPPDGTGLRACESKTDHTPAWLDGSSFFPQLIRRHVSVVPKEFPRRDD